ncbi:hypothetical protein DRN98_06830 [Methanosarcinales archaeon]|nr:MAG: hypothetical protein DRN98_06830 [Methanosarcinales archaeon]
MFILISLSLSFIYFFSKPKVFMAGVVAGILFIILGALVSTHSFEREYCFNVINQTNTSLENITTYTNDVLCKTYIYPINSNLKLALGSLFMLLGVGYILYIYGTDTGFRNKKIEE